ncbi:hypothetical protein RF11_01502 [Thelohanellus kitauei]|uniref:Uncharacterized protein n=1 Tax=Thelohanellus kitauei TaxID=669202 RepID=A0A0C2MCW0_THEKT|nr:hypothetical protein RF11_01502 [Thelohanellus kitauei]
MYDGVMNTSTEEKIKKFLTAKRDKTLLKYQNTLKQCEIEHHNISSTMHKIKELHNLLTKARNQNANQLRNRSVLESFRDKLTQQTRQAEVACSHINSLIQINGVSPIPQVSVLFTGNIDAEYFEALCEHQELDAMIKNIQKRKTQASNDSLNYLKKIESETKETDDMIRKLQNRIKNANDKFCSIKKKFEMCSHYYEQIKQCAHQTSDTISNTLQLVRELDFSTIYIPDKSQIHEHTNNLLNFYEKYQDRSSNIGYFASEIGLSLEMGDTVLKNYVNMVEQDIYQQAISNDDFKEYSPLWFNNHRLCQTMKNVDKMKEKCEQGVEVYEGIMGNIHEISTGKRELENLKSTIIDWYF